MNLIEFSAIIFCIAYLAGILGVLTGLGGGILIVPVLVILFNIDIRLAMGAALVSVIATSSGAAIAFIKGHYTNIRLGMFLESGAVVGAILGALLVHVIPVNLISIIFGIILLGSTWASLKNLKDRVHTAPSHPWAQQLHLDGQQKTATGTVPYHVYKVPLGLTLMTLAGALSGLLGIGSGAFKVLALDLAMGIPYKISTSTSSFMLGMTATASAGIYLAAGYINPVIAFPVMLGVLLGAWTGIKIFIVFKPHTLRIIFSFVILCLALQMIYRGLLG